MLSDPAARAASEPVPGVPRGRRRCQGCGGGPRGPPRREVLLDAAAVNDVQDLHPAADAKDGHAALDGGAHQRELVGVALLLYGPVSGWGSWP